MHPAAAGEKLLIRSSRRNTDATKDPSQHRSRGTVAPALHSSAFHSAVLSIKLREDQT